MAKKIPPKATQTASTSSMASSSIEEMLVAAQRRGDGSLETGRYLITYKPNALHEGMKSLSDLGLRTADARDFENQAVRLEDVGAADAVMFPEIGVALVSGDSFRARGMSVQDEIASDSPIEAIEPEYFAFALGGRDEFMRGFLNAADAIAKGLVETESSEVDAEMQVQALGNTWGLVACKVPPGLRSGAGIRVAVLDTGLDLAHPDFAGRVIVTNTFVGQPVQDLHSHGTHCIGTSCGPKAPPGNIQRYGIAFKAQIYAGKVLNNSGSGATASVLAGMNWAIANRCAVISMSLGSASPVQAAYTAAGNSALANGCLIIAAAGNDAAATGAPANSPSIMSVASLDASLVPSAFSNFGKVEIAAPGRDVFSSVPMPARYGIKSGTSMATPHVAGCAALWAETSPNFRGTTLWKKLVSTAKPLAFPPAKVGAGLVQAP